MSDFQQKTIAFIGAGNMASAIIGGLVASGYNPALITASNPTRTKLDKLADELNINTTTDNVQASQASDIIILAVKPWFIKEVCQQIAPQAKDKLIISVAAGKTIDTIANYLQRDAKGIVRAMPNTPCLVKQGAIGLFADEQTKAQCSPTIEHIFSTVGYSAWLENEQQINVITTLSGSAPAFYFYLSEALTKAGIELGIDEAICKEFVAHTALGAGKMLMADENLDANALRQKVTSPNGTTFAATEHFDNQQMQQIIIDGVKAGVTRGEQLAQDE
jgi:pyrroline-5-carboxylate reductase